MSQGFSSPFDTSEPLDIGTIFNPYPSYEQMRTNDPVHWNEPMQSWDLARYADMMEVLRDHRMSSDRISMYSGSIPEALQEKMAPILRIFSGMMLLSNPPDHTRLRSLANKAFTPRVVEEMRTNIQSITDRLLDNVQGREGMDVIQDFAYPLPVAVISEMLGMAPEDQDRFKKWTDDVAAFLGDFRRAAENVEGARRSALDMIEYLRGIIKERRDNPKPDLMTALVAAEEEGERFSEDELFSMFVLLQIGGHETATNQIGNGLLSSLQNPSEIDKLRAQPSLLPNAVEKLLRFQSPVQSSGRIALEDLEIAGQHIAKSTTVRTYFGAANRGPAQFPDPDRLDVSWEDKRPVAFGFGPHFCLGAALARMEDQIAIGTLSMRHPALRLAPPFSTGSKLEDFPWRNNPVFHGLESLRVSI